MGTTLSRLWAPFLLAITAFAVHLLPFLYSTNPLGYDTGFYRRYLIQPFVSFPNPAVPGLGSDALLPRLILDTLHFLHFSPEVALYGSYVLFFTLLPILFYYWLRPHLGARGALIGGALLALSPVGYTAFWYMLYKNAFALCLILLAFIAYEKRLLWPLLALDIAISFSHKTSAIIYLLTLCTLLLLDLRRWKAVAPHIALTAACLSFSLLSISVSPQTLGSNAVAVFLEWSDYLALSLPLIAMALYTIARRDSLIVPKTLVAFALVSSAFPVFHLPFYQRIFVFSDIALVALAAYGIELLIAKIHFDDESWAPYGSFVILCIVVGLHLGSLQSQVTKLQPLQSAAHLEQITAIGNLVPPDGLLLTTNAEAPWYEGWTLAHVAAPGMLHDTHNFPTWVKFWESTSTPEQIAFLNTFPKPLYVSTLEDFSNLVNTPPPCLTKVTPNLLRNDCQ